MILEFREIINTSSANGQHLCHLQRSYVKISSESWILRTAIPFLSAHQPQQRGGWKMLWVEHMTTRLGAGSVSHWTTEDSSRLLFTFLLLLLAKASVILQSSCYIKQKPLHEIGNFPYFILNMLSENLRKSFWCHIGEYVFLFSFFWRAERGIMLSPYRGHKWTTNPFLPVKM